MFLVDFVVLHVKPTPLYLILDACYSFFIKIRAKKYPTLQTSGSTVYSQKSQPETDFLKWFFIHKLDASLQITVHCQIILQ